MKQPEPIDILVACNGKRALKKAIFFSAVSCLGVIFFFEFDSPNISQLKHTFGKYLTPAMLLIAGYFWVHFFKSKQHSLRITAEYISWEEIGNIHSIEWPSIQSINIIDMIKVGKQGLIYEFNINGHFDVLDVKPTLNVNDYNIDPAYLFSIVNKLEKQYNFTVFSHV